MVACSVVINVVQQVSVSWNHCFNEQSQSCVVGKTARLSTCG